MEIDDKNVMEVREEAVEADVGMENGAEEQVESAEKSVSNEAIPTLYVSKLSRNVKEQHLTEIFGSFGTVKRVDLQVDRRNGVSKGFASIQFNTADDAELAKIHLDGGQIDGMVIEVSDKSPQERKVKLDTNRDVEKKSVPSKAAKSGEGTEKRPLPRSEPTDGQMPRNYRESGKGPAQGPRSIPSRGPAQGDAQRTMRDKADRERRPPVDRDPQRERTRADVRTESNGRPDSGFRNSRERRSDFRLPVNSRPLRDSSLARYGPSNSTGNREIQRASEDRRDRTLSDRPLRRSRERFPDRGERFRDRGPPYDGRQDRYPPPRQQFPVRRQQRPSPVGRGPTYRSRERAMVRRPLSRSRSPINGRDRRGRSRSASRNNVRRPDRRRSHSSTSTRSRRNRRSVSSASTRSRRSRNSNSSGSSYRYRRRYRSFSRSSSSSFRRRSRSKSESRSRSRGRSTSPGSPRRRVRRSASDSSKSRSPYHSRSYSSRSASKSRSVSPVRS